MNVSWNPLGGRTVGSVTPSQKQPAAVLENKLRGNNDSFSLRFGATHRMAQPNTIAQSRFQNDRVTLDASNLAASLVEKLDEIMTVTGETYSKNEAFTTLIDMSIPYPPRLLVEAQGKARLNAQLNAQVEHTMNAGKTGQNGLMVMNAAGRLQNGTPLATARATFMAINPTSVNAIDPETGKEKNLQPVPVTPLNLGAGDTEQNTVASTWNNGLGGFYRSVGSRLGARDKNQALPDLANLPATDTRLINRNVYVTTQMLNKKKTGHGGIAAGMAMNDMEALAKRFLKKDTVIPARISATYLDKFVESDALQFDTTLDHVDTDGHLYLSTRISKLDTKGQTVTGPVILVHSQFDAYDLKDGGIQPSTSNRPLVSAATDVDADQRRQEAIAWSQLSA